MGLRRPRMWREIFEPIKSTKGTLRLIFFFRLVKVYVQGRLIRPPRGTKVKIPAAVKLWTRRVTKCKNRRTLQTSADLKVS